MHVPRHIHFNDGSGVENGEARQALRLGLRLTALQFAGRAYGHHLQYRFRQVEVRPGLAPDDGDQADRLPPRTPERGSDIALGHHLLEHRIPGKQMANIPGK